MQPPRPAARTWRKADARPRRSDFYLLSDDEREYEIALEAECAERGR
jgi:hypothetical protein